MGRNGGRDENDLIEPECLPNFFCSPEMTEMDGVEGPSKQPNPSPTRLLFNFSTLLHKKSEIRRSKPETNPNMMTS
jgi:hypothetical protein